jgi:hypothetical protein
MYHDRTAWRCAFFVGNMEVKDIHKEMLPIWAQAGVPFGQKTVWALGQVTTLCGRQTPPFAMGM